MSSQQQVNELKGHVGWVHSAAFSRDGTRIVTASDDGTARVWEKESGNFVELKGHDDAVSFAAFSPDGSHVVTAFAMARPAFMTRPAEFPSPSHCHAD